MTNEIDIGDLAFEEDEPPKIDSSKKRPISSVLGHRASKSEPETKKLRLDTEPQRTGVAKKRGASSLELSDENTVPQSRSTKPVPQRPSVTKKPVASLDWEEDDYDVKAQSTKPIVTKRRKPSSDILDTWETTPAPVAPVTQRKPPPKKREVSLNVPDWESNPAEVPDFDKKLAMVTDREVQKWQYLFKIEPASKFNKNLWRKICIRGNATLHALHGAIQTAFAWQDIMPHRFVTANGLPIGKVLHGLRGNERQIHVSQVAPSKAFFFTYQHGSMFDWRISVEHIGRQDALISPRLCAGCGDPPPETVETPEQYEAWNKQKKKPGEQFDIDAVNTVFLGTKTIKLYSGMRKNMTEEERQRFALMQMCTFPEDFGAL